MSRSSKIQDLRKSVAVLMIWVGTSAPLSAITIDVNYITGNSNAPAGDANGAMLTSLAQAAAAHWSDIIEDPWTMKINVWYDTNAVLGGANAFAPIVTANAEETRTIEGDIVFNNSTAWYYDPTPNVHSEYNMQQRLFGDLSAIDQTAQYNATTPTNLLEESYSGVVFGGSSAVGLLDMYTVMLHEIGHHLGVTNQLDKAVDEWQGDSDYDLPPSLLSGRQMAVRTSDNFGHLAPGNDPQRMVSGKLLQPAVPGNFRTLPSATDVLAAAKVGGWNQIDLPRQDLLDGSTWSTAANWEGGKVPDGADDAYVRLGGTINLDVNDVVRNLFVGNSTVFRTGFNRILAGDTVTVDFDGTFPVSRLVVENGGEVGTPALNIIGGQLDMEGGLVDVQALVIDKVGNSGSAVGFGTVDVSNSLTNNGTISAGNGGTLTFTAPSSAAVFDLDGDAGDGVVLAIGGNLTFSDNVDPSFAGSMTVANSREITIASPWTLNPGGTLALVGNTTSFASANLRGGELTVASTVNIDKKAGLLVPLTITQQAQVNIPDADDTLEVGLEPGQTTTLAGGNITGNGSINFNGSVVVPANTSPVVDVNAGVRGPLAVSGVAIFQRDVDLGAASATTLSGNGALELHGETIFRGGSFNGNGIVLVNDMARIVDDQLIDITGTFDLDGLTNNSLLIVEDGKRLDLRATAIDFDNIYNGDISLSNGLLLVDIDADVWTMAGSLLMSGVGGSGSILANDAIDFTGDLTVAGGPTHTIAATTRMLPGSSTTVGFGTRLQYNAPVTYEGGNHSIVGEIGIADSATINGGSLSVVDMEVGGSATLTINGGNTSVNSFTKSSGGTFDFNGGNFRVSGGDAIFNSSLPIGGPTLGGQPTLIVENGGNAVGSAAFIGNAAGEFGAAIVRGTNANGSRRSTLRSTGGGAGIDLRIGQHGTGTLLIEDGGLVTYSDDVEIARESASSVGTVTVRGVANASGNLIRSELRAGDTLLVGRLGDATLNIEDGALVTSGDNVSVATNANATGAVHIGGSSHGFSAELDATGNVITIGGATGNPGVFNLNGGGLATANSMVVNDQGTVNMTGGVLDVPTLNLNAAGSTFNMTGGRLQTAHVFGSLAHNGGTIAPDESPSAALIAGNYDQSGGGRLEIEIGGLTLGTEFDHLEVDDTALLGDGLDVLLIEGFMPSLGDAFQILRATDVIDVFTSLTLPDLGENLQWAVNYNPADVVLEVVEPTLGDFNGDLLVDGFDFLQWQRGQSPNPSGASDLAQWEANYGLTLSARSTSAAVPEPTTALLLLGLWILNISKRKQHGRTELAAGNSGARMSVKLC